MVLEARPPRALDGRVVSPNIVAFTREAIIRPIERVKRDHRARRLRSRWIAVAQCFRRMWGLILAHQHNEGTEVCVRMASLVIDCLDVIYL